MDKSNLPHRASRLVRESTRLLDLCIDGSTEMSILHQLTRTEAVLATLKKIVGPVPEKTPPKEEGQSPSDEDIVNDFAKRLTLGAVENFEVGEEFGWAELLTRAKVLYPPELETPIRIATSNFIFECEELFLLDTGKVRRIHPGERQPEVEDLTQFPFLAKGTVHPDKSTPKSEMAKTLKLMGELEDVILKKLPGTQFTLLNLLHDVPSSKVYEARELYRLSLVLRDFAEHNPLFSWHTLDRCGESVYVRNEWK